MVFAKFMYFILPFVALFGFSECQECLEAKFKPANIDISKINGVYTMVGFVFLNNKDNSDNANGGTTNTVYNTSSCPTKGFVFTPDTDDNVKVAMGGTEEWQQIKFPNPNEGRGVYYYNNTDPKESLPVTILELSDTNIALTLCFNTGGVETGVSYIYLLTRSDTPVDGSSFFTDFQKILTDFSDIKKYIAFNYCLDGRQDVKAEGARK